MLSITDKDYGTPAQTAAQTIELEIDGKPIIVPAGTSVMRAAAMAGVSVPKLCATDSLAAYGSCRLCLVEIEGRKGYPASCTTPAEPGMKVLTQTPRVADLRRNVMELYISDHPLDCLTCPANGNCELQDMAGVVGLRHVRYGYEGKNHLDSNKDESNPYFTFDPSKCIVCARCVRACEETQGTFALTIDGRGFGSVISPGQNGSFMESECVSCGACVQACPTATLIEKSVIDRGQAEHSVITTCGYCGVGCSFKAEMKGNEVVRMVPNKDGMPNHGHSCVKGRFAWGYATHPDRVRKPMVRERIDEPWREVTWEEAINYAAAGLRRISAKIRTRRGRRYHLLAMHQRRNLPGPKARARRPGQQQCRYLRPGMPFADRLWIEDRVRHVGRHFGLRLGTKGGCRPDDRRQSHRGPSGIRFDNEAPPAPGRQADCRRPPPD